MARYWVFGASKPLGIGLATHLKAFHEVTCFSRTVPAGEAESPSFVRVDFGEIEKTRATVQEQMVLDVPDGAVFCQRYRPSAGQSDLDAIKAGLDVELAPVLTVVEAVNAAKREKSFSLVLISSVAGLTAHKDIPLYYHLLKAVTVSAAKTLAAHGAPRGLRVNCIVLGEFEKHSRARYTAQEQAKFNTLENFTLSRRLCTISDIAGVAGFLLSDNAGCMTGQVLHLDGGISGLAPESVVRTLLAKS